MCEVGCSTGADSSLLPALSDNKRTVVNSDCHFQLSFLPEVLFYPVEVDKICAPDMDTVMTAFYLIIKGLKGI